MSRQIKAALFDFDGTLAVLRIDFNEMRARVSGIVSRLAPDFADAESRWTLELIDAVTEHLENHAATTSRNRRISEQLATSPASRFRAIALEAVESVEMEAVKEGAWLPQVDATLRNLRESGIRVGVVTRNCRRAVEAVAGPSHSWCDVLLTRDDVPNVKPNPSHLEEALQFLSVPPSYAIMVGDHASDMMAARAAGIPAIGVLSRNASRDLLIEAGASDVLNSVVDLPSWLARAESR